MTSFRERVREILDNLLSDWADGKIDNPDHATQAIIDEMMGVVGKEQQYEETPLMLGHFEYADGYNACREEILKRLK